MILPSNSKPQALNPNGWFKGKGQETRDNSLSSIQTLTYLPCLRIWGLGFSLLIVLLLTLCTPGTLFSQEVYLRLTEYGGGKINLVVKPFGVKDASDDVVVMTKTIETIVRYDLDYSLYFELFEDTILPRDSENQAVVVEGIGERSRLTIILKDLASQEKIMEKEYIIDENVREQAHRISDDIIEYTVGEQGIASTKIVFSYKASDSKELAMIDYDGYTLTPLTSNGKYNLFPAWAPDGKRVLFSTHSADRLNIYLFDLIERKITVISSFRGLNFAPCWSPDGAKICLSLTKDGDSEIYLLDLATRKLNRLTYNRAIDTSPTFSPNSREIAFVSDRTGNPQVYVMDIHGGNIRRLTFHGNYNTSPAWSPRGDIIAYVSREDDLSHQIYVTDPYDFSPVRLTSNGNNEEPSWSPDGLHIVYSSNGSGQYELYTMNWDGSRKRKLTRGLAAYAPDWSPIFK